MNQPWWTDAIFYHVFPLAYCEAAAESAPQSSTSDGPVENRLARIADDLERIRALGCNALYLGPLFESGSHGYDTHDYFSVDRRLGDDDDLADLVGRAHDCGMRVVLDGVYNHVGRGFHAFRRLLEEGPESQYRRWFRGVSFDRDNRFGDGFVYEGWEGVEELVALNHDEPAVREHLLGAAEHALDRYAIDGIRLDVAYSLPFEFLEALSARLRAKREDFWLMGEVIHGDYAAFVAPGRLTSVTNYECYKGLWSSCNDRNLHEIAHSLNRLFGDGGMLADALGRGQLTYNFADNHDVSRVASVLENTAHLVPLYALLWTMPGIPSVYYGSEYALEGRKKDGDAALRPSAARVLEAARRDGRLAGFIAELGRARTSSEALRVGAYRPLVVESAVLAFERVAGDERVVVAVNLDAEPAEVELPSAGRYECLLGGETVSLAPGRPLQVPACGVRIVRLV